MELAEAGRIETIIVKDHSRLGRNRLVVGQLLEEDFVRLSVRYIAIMDNIDTKDCLLYTSISGIFSYGQNEEAEGKDEHSRDALERIIKDYNEMYSTNFSTDTFSAYHKDISDRVKGKKTKSLDIRLVVNMVLTGFEMCIRDSRYAHLFPTRQVEMADKLDSLKNEKGV